MWKSPFGFNVAMSKLAHILFVSTSVMQVAGSPPWACALKRCVLKSALASAGPSFANIVEFKAMGAQQKNAQEQCPFGGDDGPPPSEKEYKKYMTGLDKIGDMNPAERRAWAAKVAAAAKMQTSDEIERAEMRAQERHQADLRVMEAKDRAQINPSVDVSAPGVEAVNEAALDELRKKKAYDILVTFYAPWCPHCKAFVTNENAPIAALSASLEKSNGPKVVTFDVTASNIPSDVKVDSVPAIYLFRKTGLPIAFNEDPHDLKRLTAFALGDAPTPTVLLATSARRHVVRKLAKKRLRGPNEESQDLMGSGDEYVDPEKAFHSIGEETYVTVVSPPPSAPLQDQDQDVSNTADEYVDPDKDFHTVNVVRSDQSSSKEDQTFHVIGEQEEYVDPEAAFHPVSAQEEYITVVNPQASA